MFGGGRSGSLFLSRCYRTVRSRVRVLQGGVLDLSHRIRRLDTRPRRINGRAGRRVLRRRERHVTERLRSSIDRRLFTTVVVLSTIGRQTRTFPRGVRGRVHLVRNVVGRSRSRVQTLLLRLHPAGLRNGSLGGKVRRLLIRLGSGIRVTVG